MRICVKCEFLSNLLVLKKRMGGGEGVEGGGGGGKPGGAIYLLFGRDQTAPELIFPYLDFPYYSYFLA